jgi:hypothetical protein
MIKNIGMGLDLDKLKAHLESEEGLAHAKQYFTAFERYDDRVKERATDLHHKLEVSSDKEVSRFRNWFLKWEEKYQDMWYARRVQTNSRLFEMVWIMFREYGTELEANDDFLSERHEYRGYVMSLYRGQGAFFAITKNGKRIF